MLRFNLRSLVRRARPRMFRVGKVLVLRDNPPPSVLNGNLQRLYMRIVRRWWEASRDQLVPAYRSALEREVSRRQSGVTMDDDGLAGVMTAIGQQVDRLVLELTPELREWVLTVEKWQAGRWVASLTPSGVDLKTLIGPDDVQATIEATLQQNVSLVRNVSETMRRQIEQAVFQGFQQRLPVRTIAAQLSEIAGFSRTRAIGIAIDQTQKLSAQLDTERMEQAGLDEFEWVHSGKLHFRPWHRERNGRRFKLRGEIDPDDMPGVPPFCGCRKRAVLPLAE